MGFSRRAWRTVPYRRDRRVEEERSWLRHEKDAEQRAASIFLEPQIEEDGPAEVCCTMRRHRARNSSCVSVCFIKLQVEQQGNALL